jgi:GTP-binding protein
LSRHAVSAEFMLSASDSRQFPSSESPEYAFLGRSNVGKSSLLNTLVGQRRLAFFSSTPGRTQSINFYRVDGDLLFVDLPGYGYAKVAREVAQAWGRVVETYLKERSSLTLALLLLDARRGWMEKDLQLRDWLEFHQRPYLVVATKVDKLNQKERSDSEKAIRREQPAGDLVWFSAVTGQGVREIWQTITKTRTR